MSTRSRFNNRNRANRRLWAPLGALALLVASVGAQAETNVQLPSAGAHGYRSGTHHGSVFTNARSTRSGHHETRRDHDRYTRHYKKPHYDKRGAWPTHARHDNRRYHGWRGQAYDRDHERGHYRHDNRRRSSRDRYERGHDRGRHHEVRRDHDRDRNRSSWFGLR